jgi:hypothetical protein
MKPLRFFLLAATLSLALRPDRLLAQTYYGIEIKSKNVVFLLDISGSMENRDEKTGTVRSQAIDAARDVAGRIGGWVGRKASERIQSETTKLGAARRELIRALQSLPSDTRFTIITFGEGVREWPGGFRQISGGARQAAQVYVFQLSATGETPMRTAMSQAILSSDVDAIFLVSDGRPTDGSSAQILADVANRKNLSPLTLWGLAPTRMSSFYAC